jgi:hypothetical protein
MIKGNYRVRFNVYNEVLDGRTLEDFSAHNQLHLLSAEFERIVNKYNLSNDFKTRALCFNNYATLMDNCPKETKERFVWALKNYSHISALIYSSSFSQNKSFLNSNGTIYAVDIFPDSVRWGLFQNLEASRETVDLVKNDTLTFLTIVNDMIRRHPTSCSFSHKALRVLKIVLDRMPARRPLFLAEFACDIIEQNPVHSTVDIFGDLDMNEFMSTIETKSMRVRYMLLSKYFSIKTNTNFMLSGKLKYTISMYKFFDGQPNCRKVVCDYAAEVLEINDIFNEYKRGTSFGKDVVCNSLNSDGNSTFDHRVIKSFIEEPIEFVFKYGKDLLNHISSYTSPATGKKQIIRVNDFYTGCLKLPNLEMRYKKEVAEKVATFIVDLVLKYGSPNSTGNHSRIILSFHKDGGSDAFKAKIESAFIRFCEHASFIRILSELKDPVDVSHEIGMAIVKACISPTGYTALCNMENVNIPESVFLECMVDFTVEPKFIFK